MGYDMTWEQEPEDVVAAKAAWEQTWNEGNGVNKPVLDKYLEMQSEAGSYYRLNIWGMGNMRELLGAGGALTWEVAGGPGNAIEFDTGGVLPGYKLCSNDGWLVSPAECMATALTWFEGGGRLKAQSTAETVAEEWNKEGDPVTPEKVLAWVDEFVSWIAEATRHGGFRVY